MRDSVEQSFVTVYKHDVTLTRTLNSEHTHVQILSWLSSKKAGLGIGDEQSLSFTDT